VSGTLDELESLLDRSEDVDDALRDTVRLLAEEPDVSWAGVAFADEGALVLGPSAGEPAPERRLRAPVVFQGETVGELWVDGDVDEAVLDRVASLIAAHVLIGWDIGGETWDP
jgi:hypothetical protein